MSYTYTQYLNSECSFKQYADSLETARELEVGKRYTTCHGNWRDTIYTIVYIGNGVALGVETWERVVNKGKYHSIGSSADKCLFNTVGCNAGWKYNDNRPEYRLKEIE